MEDRFVPVLGALLLITVGFVSIAGAQLPELPEEPPSEIEVGLGDAYFDALDEDDGDWTAESPAGATGWEWGQPTVGPVLEDEDRKMWGTNLDGDYSANECSSITSPPIDLTTPEALAANEATLTWDQWYQSSSISAGGVIQIGVDGDYQVIEPDGGYPDSSDDDLVGCLDNEDIGQYDGFEDSSFGGPSTHTADISGFLGEEITIRFLLASEDTSFTYDGWYVDNVGVALQLAAESPSASADHPGWTSDEGSQWAWGVATEEGPVGQLVYGTTLDGDFIDGECSGIQTAVDVPVAAGELSWDQWLRSSSFRAGGVIQVVDAEGAHNIVPNEGYTSSFAYDWLDDCLQHETQGTDTMSGFEQFGDDPMETFTADISDWAGEQVTLRFVWGADNNFGSYPGWYINNVTLDGIPLMLNSPAVLQELPEDTDPETLVEELEGQANALVGQAEAQLEQYPGWTVGGEFISWAYDEASTGPVGEMVTATNPHGVHSTDGDYECSYLQSPPVPTALLEGEPTLSMDHMVDMSVSSWSGARTAGLLLVSTDLGATWEAVETDANNEEVFYTRIYDCFEQHGVEDARDVDDTIGVISGENGGLETLEVDLGAYADAPTLTVRLVFGTGTTLSAQGGWYVNNVNLGGVQLMP